MRYWQNYWNTSSIIKDKCSQKQVGRTSIKQPVSKAVWEKTLRFVWKEMGINRDSNVLELCSGNGMLTIPLAKVVNNVTAVDFSEPLVGNLRKQLELENITNVTTIVEDINKNVFPEGIFSHVLMYFAIQHFNEKDIINLMEKVYGSLQDNGVFYIGDIPDRARLWDFANTDEYASMYFMSIKNDTPAIGTWFLQKDLIMLGKWVGFTKFQIVNQPEYQINSKYRFDILLRK